LLQYKYRTVLANVFDFDIASAADAYPAFHAHLKARYDALGRESQLSRKGQRKLDRDRRTANDRVGVFGAWSLSAAFFL
jgi:hypothetical protein